MPHDVQKCNFWPLPKAPGGGNPKNCAGACAIYVSNSHTKSGWIFFLTPHCTPKSHPWAWPRRPNENPVLYVIYLSFVRRYTKFGLKIFEIGFVIQIKWYLTFWPLPKAPGGRDQKNGAGACAFHVSDSHTKSEWILKKKNLTAPPPPPPPHPRYPQVPPLAHDLGDQMKIPSDMFYIFHVWEDTQSLVKNLWNWLCNWNLMIFNDIWPFDPSPGGGAKKNVPWHASFMWPTDTPNLVGFSSNGLGGDSVTDRRMDGRSRLQYPRRFFKKAWG